MQIVGFLILGVALLFTVGNLWVAGILTIIGAVFLFVGQNRMFKRWEREDQERRNEANKAMRKRLEDTLNEIRSRKDL